MSDARSEALEASTRQARLDGRAVICLIGCSFLWGLNPVVVKLALAEVGPLQQAALRSAGGAVMLWVWARWRGVSLFDRDGTLGAGLLAGLLFAGEFACVFAGLQMTSASRMSVFVYLSPFLVALGMPFIARSERMTPPQVTGLVVAFGGVAWAYADGFTQPAAGPRQWLGDLLGLAGAALWAATTLTIRASRLSRAAPEKTLFYQLAVSALVLLLALGFTPQALPAAALSPTVIGSLLFQVVVVVFGSYLVWFWLVRHYPATRLSVFVLLTPVFGLLLGLLLLDEPVTLRLVLALAAVVVGIGLVNRPGSQHVDATRDGRGRMSGRAVPAQRVRAQPRMRRTSAVVECPSTNDSARASPAPGSYQRRLGQGLDVVVAALHVPLRTNPLQQFDRRGFVEADHEAHAFPGPRAHRPDRPVCSAAAQAPCRACAPRHRCSARRPGWPRVRAPAPGTSRVRGAAGRTPRS